jgi:SAM-dependent methyltransferase
MKKLSETYRERPRRGTASRQKAMNTPKDSTGGCCPPPPCSASLPPVLDACCGGRMMWFDPKDPRCLFVDKRCESFSVDKRSDELFHVNPDMVADFTSLPFPDATFALVVFDPPHIIRKEARGWITRKYGVLNGEWREMLRKGFAECFRVLRNDGTLIFKWSDSNVLVSQILPLTPHKPLFGHKSGKAMNTHWIAFLKPNDEVEQHCSD